MSKAIRSAQKAYVTPPAKVRPWLLDGMRVIGPAYFRRLLGFASLEMRHAERLVEAYRDFSDGKRRLLIAFRHPYGDEAQLISYVVGRQLIREAARLGVRFPRKPHAHFLYGFEVPLWSGPFERFVLPRVGAVPVYHSKFDGASMKLIRDLVKDSEYPVALAPEGQVCYSSETLPRLEPGVIRIALWCAQDLIRAGRSEPVTIVPLSVHHRWSPGAGRRLDALISLTERVCGIRGGEKIGRMQRLSAIADRALRLMEDYYERFHGLVPATGCPRNQRLAAVVKTALDTCESILGLPHRGEVMPRVYKIRQVMWDRMFRSDIPDFGALSPSNVGLRTGWRRRLGWPRGTWNWSTWRISLILNGFRPVIRWSCT